VSARAQRQRLANQAEPMKALEKLIREQSYRHQLHTVFSDFCELSALAISNSVDLSRREKREERYLQIAGRYTAEELARFPKMLGCLVEALEHEMRDHLGKLFMALELGNHWHGQFFTPYELALLMAQMQLHDAAALIDAKGFITVCEPAAGAGGMVVACAQALREQGLNYQQVMHVVAQDLDPTAAHMCYLQMSLLHVPGVVIVGDTLRMTESDRWYTPAHFLGLWDWKLRRRERYEGETAPAVEAAPVVEAPPPLVAQRKIGAGQLDLFGGVA
jgi:hypothetical protein